MSNDSVPGGQPPEVSEKRAAASRANGAKSRGPKTPEGKARSSQNALKHSVYAKAVVLSNEDHALFESFKAAFYHRFQPIDEVEADLVDEMVAARWRMRRFCYTLTAAIDLEMHRQIPEVDRQFTSIPEPFRASLALTKLAKDAGPHAPRRARLRPPVHPRPQQPARAPAAAPAPGPPASAGASAK